MNDDLPPDLANLYFANECDGYPEGFCNSWIRSRVLADISDFLARQFCLPRIAALLRFSRPTAIARPVADVVIDTFEGEADRFFAHVGEKIFKAERPSFADIYATVAVEFRHGMPVFGAPSFHVDPRSVCSRALAFARVAMSEWASIRVHGRSLT